MQPQRHHARQQREDHQRPRDRRAWHVAEAERGKRGREIADGARAQHD